jgi:hypothetical protein
MLAAAVTLCASLRPEGTAAQGLAELTATPDAAAELFIRSVRSLRWSAAAQFVDDETLGLFRDVVTMITEPEETGALLEYLTGTDPTGYDRLEPREVFDRALTALIADMPGLSHSFSDRDDEFLGHVAETPDSAHVVYRTEARISGAVPEVKVMQMRRGSAGWRVLWSDELDVLEAALRGAHRMR